MKNTECQKFFFVKTEKSTFLMECFEADKKIENACHIWFKTTKLSCFNVKSNCFT